MQISRRDAGGKLVTRDADPLEAVQADDVVFLKESLF
jgi:hypothetical protein